MAFEETPQIGLVGEVHPIGDLLQRKIGKHEHQFDFVYDPLVDHLLGGLAGQRARHGGQVTHPACDGRPPPDNGCSSAEPCRKRSVGYDASAGT